MGVVGMGHIMQIVRALGLGGREMWRWAGDLMTEWIELCPLCY